MERGTPLYNAALSQVLGDSGACWGEEIQQTGIGENIQESKGSDQVSTRSPVRQGGTGGCITGPGGAHITNDRRMGGLTYPVPKGRGAHISQ